MHVPPFRQRINVQAEELHVLVKNAYFQRGQRIALEMSVFRRRGRGANCGSEKAAPAICSQEERGVLWK
jgi:hypothetical protein